MPGRLAKAPVEVAGYAIIPRALITNSDAELCPACGRPWPDSDDPGVEHDGATDLRGQPVCTNTDPDLYAALHEVRFLR